MKKQRILTLIIVGMVTLLLSAGPVLAKSEKVYFDCTDSRIWAESGTDFIQENPVDRYHIRGRHVIVRVNCECTDPEPDDVCRWIKGDRHLSESANLNMPAKQGGTGVLFGTFEFFPDELCTAKETFGTYEVCTEGDGSWVGTYTRKLTEDLVIFSLVGHGTGVLEVLKIKRNDVNERGNPPTPFTGYILDPHGDFGD
jgi:hypothetical protein